MSEPGTSGPPSAGGPNDPPPETPSDLLGRMLGGHRILEKVGEGGMGSVFRAHDTALDRVVAIKILPPALAHDEEYRVRFLREARALARVRHPNLVPIYTVAEERGVYYFAMEFLEGESLRECVATAGPMELGEMLRVAGQVLGALASVHAAGITHRDVKSQNIMLEPTGRAVLMDLGLAKDEAAETVTTAGMVLGTPEFMSPEQAEGVPATPLSDIYSFGIVLYELATGGVPFGGRSAIAILRKQVDAEAAPVAGKRPDLPPEFAGAVSRAMSKKPAERPQSAAELASLLLEAGRTPELEALAASPPGPGVVTVETRAMPGSGSTYATRAESTAPTVVDRRRAALAAKTPPAAERGQGVRVGPLVAIVAGVALLAVLLGVVYERLTRPKPQPASKLEAAVAETTEKKPAPEEMRRRANVLASDGTVLWENVFVIALTGEGIVIEESDGNTRLLLYESIPRLEYLHGVETD